MKQSKRMLSVLLALIMIISTFTIGANALKEDYLNPAGYDEVLDPYVTPNQAASMLLDYLDNEVLADVNLYYTLDYWVGKLTIDIHNVDSLLDTLKGLNQNGALSFVQTIGNLGDIEDLDLSAGEIKDSKGNLCRRNNQTSTDFEVLFAVLSFVENNAAQIAKFVYNGFDFGWLESLGVIDPQVTLAVLNDVHGLITGVVYDAIYGKGASTAEGTAYKATDTLDSILQKFIDTDLIKLIVDLFAQDDGTNKIAEILGLNDKLDAFGELSESVPTTTIFPSLTPGKLGYLSLNNDGAFTFIRKIINAFIQDIILPYAGDLISEALGEEGGGYIDIIVEVLNLGLEFPEGADSKTKIDMLLQYLLVGEGKTRFICLKEVSPGVEYLAFADGFFDELCNLIKVALPMLPNFWPDSPDIDKTDAELSTMTTEELVTYILEVFLNQFVDGVEFATGCTSIRELASKTLVEVAAELIPSIDFEAKFENKELEYNSDDCLTVGSYIIRYYLNGETTIQDNTPDNRMGIVAMFNTAVDWALEKVGALFGYNASKYPANDPTQVWNKLYDTVFQWIPLNIFYGIEDSAQGVEDLVMNRIIGGILNFVVDENSTEPTGLNALLSLIGINTNSDLNKSIPNLIGDLLGRVINPLFGLPAERDVTSSYDQLNLIIPYSYTTLDQIIAVNNNTTTLSLTNTVYRLCTSLPYTHATQNSLLIQAMPLVMMLMKLWTYDTYPFVESIAPVGSKIYSGKALNELYDKYKETANDDLSYDDDNYSYFHMVDFKPFLYLEFKRVRSETARVVNQYNASLTDPEVVAPTSEEMTNTAYRLNTIARMLEQGYNMDKSAEANENDYDYYGETTANNYQLQKQLNIVADANYNQAENPDGSKTYTERTWAEYEKALAFANKVNGEYAAARTSAKALRDMRQSRINMARKMLMKAVSGLKAWIPLADYTSLDSSIDVAGYLTSLRTFSDESIQSAIDAFLSAYNIERNYDQDDQHIVDGAQEALDEALANLDQNLVDYLFLYNDGFGQYVDEKNNYVFGFEEGFANENAIIENGDFDSYMIGYYGYGLASTGDMYRLNIDGTSLGNGTGAVIKMYGTEDYEFQTPVGPEYNVIIFGDVDGDAYADACDAVLLRAYCAMKLSGDQLGSSAMYAGDVDANDTVELTDAKALEKAGVLKQPINQAPEARASQTYGIYDVLGLR